MDREKGLGLRELLRSCATELELPKGQTIHFPGNRDTSLYYIVRGAVRFVLNSYDGNEKILYILGPDTFFNEEVLFAPHDIAAHVFCQEDSTLWKIDSLVHGELMENQEFVKAVFGGMVRKNDRMRQEIENISFMSCKQRILKIFAEEYKKDAVYDQNWYDLGRRYTHQELAGIIGANRVTVSRLIIELCEENKIRSLNRRIQIHKDAVRAVTEGEKRDGV